LSLATGRWFSKGSPVSSTNKTDCHDITEILLRVGLNTIKQLKKKIVIVFNIYRITAVIKVETDIIASIAASVKG
jgi:hypothetical protein